jgi:hypothetical protein
VTGTIPRRRGPSTSVGGPAVSLSRTFRLYRFYDEAGTLLYVGITGRLPFRRLMEHVCDKPWAAQMARWEVDPRVFASEAEVLAAEKAAIIAERPRWNIAHNGNNPVRVTPMRPAPQRRPSAPGLPPSAANRVLRSRWTWLVAAWIAASVGVWAAVDRVGLTLPIRWHLGVAVGVPPAVAVGVWRWWATRGRRKLRRLKRMWQ